MSKLPISSVSYLWNTESGGHPWVESLSVLLSHCEEAVVIDCQSDDGTERLLKEWASIEPRLKLFYAKRPENSRELADRINYGVEKASQPIVLQISMDEVIDLGDMSKEVWESAFARMMSEEITIGRFHRLDYVCSARYETPIFPIGYWTKRMFARKWYPKVHSGGDGGEFRSPTDSGSVLFLWPKIMHYMGLRTEEHFKRVKYDFQKLYHDVKLEPDEKLRGGYKVALQKVVHKARKSTAPHPPAIMPWLIRSDMFLKDYLAEEMEGK